MVRLALFFTLVCGLIIAGLGTVQAQEASPVASPAAAVACDVEPRSADELLAFWYADDGTQRGSATPMADDGTEGSIIIPIGEPADEATAAAVTLVLQQVFACFDAGDALRAYALFTDDLATLFGPEPGTPRADAEAFLSSPGIDEESGVSAILAISNIMLLDDGRVGAFAVDRTDGVDSTAYVILEHVDDQWLVDEVIEFPSPMNEE